ncbi:hypothetical protein CVT25_003542 [Psilocybe cyanescens]|uniref:Uncharacterized protein n=1 Tax=Psilocybe cyanescens TaxID=93625 RepID=A0A409X6S3_PSICY|nr:hypothetical protein CVT25_003542 [Psilocybe cyanescens]
MAIKHSIDATRTEDNNVNVVEIREPCRPLQRSISSTVTLNDIDHITYAGSASADIKDAPFPPRLPPR